jgi:LysM repeat protein
MKTRLAFLLFIGALLSLNVSGQKAPAKSPIVFGSRDSLFASVSDNQTFLLHRVKPGQSLFGLSKFYNLPVGDLQAANGMADASMKTGQVLRVPIAGKAIRKKRPDIKKSAEFMPVYYRVREKETLYKIAHDYFGVHTDTLIKFNGLKNGIVAVGKVLLVGWFPRSGVPADLPGGFRNEAQKNYLELKTRFETEKASKKVIEMEGAAVWLKDDRRASDAAFFALFDHAPAGSVLEVTNPSIPATLYVKVVADLPNDAKTGNAIVLLSPAAAKHLGAIDEKFYVKIHYLK